MKLMKILTDIELFFLFEVKFIPISGYQLSEQVNTCITLV